MSQLLKKLSYGAKILFTGVKNPFSVFLFYMGLKDNVTCKLKNDFGSFEISKCNKPLLACALNAFYQIKMKKDFQNLDLFKIFVSQLNEDIVTVDGIKFYNNPSISTLFEYFMDQPFLLENMDNRIVIDIGGNIADTPLYYASRGAKVFAFEPIPPIYDIGIKNIDLNPNLKDNIQFFNKAVSNKNGEVKLFYEGLITSGATSSFENAVDSNSQSYQIESLTIKHVIENYDIVPDVLKMDCEGCEYAIVKNTDLSMFNDIFLEYHAKVVGISYNVLINELKEQGFKINHNSIFNFPIEDMGIIHAYK